MDDPFRIVYVVTVLALGLWATARTRSHFKREERLRQREFANRDDEDLNAVADTFYGERQKASARARAVRSIEGRFTVHRRLLIPLIVVTALLVASLPFMSRVPATMVSLVVAVITVAVGVAARPIVENAAAGLLMSFSRVARIGDTVRLDDWYGTVEDISTTHTTIRLWDSRRYIVPNSQMVQSKLLNYTLHDPYIWTRIDFWVSWDTDVEQMKGIALEAARDSPHAMDGEPPALWIMTTDKEAIGCWLACWARNPAESWALAEDLRLRLIRAFQQHGIVTHGLRQLVRTELTSTVTTAAVPASTEAMHPAAE